MPKEEHILKETKRYLRPKPTSVSGKGEEEGSWILSYGDMMTLLLSFFIIIVSVSTINQQKFEEVAASMAKGMGMVKKKALDEIVQEIKKIVKEENMEEQLSVELGAEGAKFSFSGQTLFELGKAELNKEAEPILDKLSKVFIKDTGQHFVIVEGHTDNIPIKSDIFPSNWELSSARASSVIRYFIEKGLKPKRCKAIGYADTQEMLPNESPDGKPIPENQAKNRRVVIKLSKNMKE